MSDDTQAVGAGKADMRVAILGAGPAGLATAHYLSSRGVPTYMLELGDRVGGLCITLERNGFKFDLGGHRWFTKNEELHAWFLELMKGELVTVQRTSRIYFEGKYFEYPISIKNVLGNAGLLKSAHAGLSYGMAVLRDLIHEQHPENRAHQREPQPSARQGAILEGDVRSRERGEKGERHHEPSQSATGRLLIPASSKRAISARIRAAETTIGMASAAPDPSPSLSSSSRRGCRASRSRITA